ncbi:hypothetical protein OG21DRAFT_1491862 [Imleria badia]|nr:hypothetical protein OG21DRAFT_1491862 [Imleria badia]
MPSALSGDVPDHLSTSQTVRNYPSPLSSALDRLSLALSSTVQHAPKRLHLALANLPPLHSWMHFQPSSGPMWSLFSVWLYCAAAAAIISLPDDSLCERRACRTHCGVMGGYSLKAHSPAAQPDSALPLRAEAGQQEDKHAPPQVEVTHSSILGHDPSQSAWLIATHEAHEETPSIPSAAGLSCPVTPGPSDSSVVLACDVDPSGLPPAAACEETPLAPSAVGPSYSSLSMPSVLPHACEETPSILSATEPSHSISASLSPSSLILSSGVHAETLSVPFVWPPTCEETPSVPSAVGPSYLSLVLHSEAYAETLPAESMIAPAVLCEETPSIPSPAGPSHNDTLHHLLVLVHRSLYAPVDEDLIPLAYHQAAQHVKNGVIVFAWKEDGACPVIHQFQDGFQFPHFIFSPSVVHKLSLSNMLL